MKKFMVLFQSPVSAQEKMAAATPEQMQASMTEWMAWKDKIGDEHFDWGMPLQSGKHIENGQVTPGQLTVNGHAYVYADSAEEAAEMLIDHPHLKSSDGASIEVLEFLPMPGFSHK